MKRIMIMLSIGCISATMAFGQSNVLSRNAVGYMKVIAPKGGFIMARMDFESLDGSDIHSEDLFGDQVPIGTAVFAWDSVASQYKIDDLSFLGWGTNIVYERGQGFWLNVPSTAASNEYCILLMGEVPDRFTATNTVVPILEGFNQVGFSYPTAIIWTNTWLASNAVIGDALFVWDGTNYFVNDLSFLGWFDPDQVVEPGQAFWFQKANAGTINWDESKPYTWP